MPGVTYDRHVEFTLHGPVVVNVVEGPRPTGLYSLEPVMARGSVQGREKLTVVERKLAPQANVVAVNGDLFTSTGRPQGLFLQDSFLQTQPVGSRSSLGIGASGTLFVDRVPFVGDWRGLGPRRGLSALNDQVGPNGTVLFTPGWGRNTPAASDAVEAVLSPFPATKPNVDLTATVTQILKGGNHPIAPGAAILYSRGNAAARLAAESAVGASLTVRMILPNPFSTAVAGIGGGPLLVKNGKPVFRSNESFSASWLIPRTARTAVGQRADGSVLLVVVDGGRPGSSVGMTNFELAQKLAGLGAVTAMGLDGGTSSTMAFDGGLLNKPSQGEKPIADALALLYTGVQADPVSPEVFAPGSDGATLSYELVRPSTVHARLLGPGSAQVELDSGQRAPGLHRFAWNGAAERGRSLDVEGLRGRRPRPSVGCRAPALAERDAPQRRGERFPDHRRPGARRDPDDPPRALGHRASHPAQAPGGRRLDVGDLGRAAGREAPRAARYLPRARDSRPTRWARSS